MKEVFCISSLKGGVGKSTTALALSAGLRKMGFRVLTIDLDQQTNLSLSMAANTGGISSLDVLTGDATIAQAIQQTPQGEIIAASPALASADIALTSARKEYRLRDALKAVAGVYDYVVIDCPPSLGVATVNALTACTGVIIPCQADLFSVQGLTQLYGTVGTVRQYCNPGLTVKGVLLTRYSPRSILSREMADTLNTIAIQHGGGVFKSFIRENIALREAPARQENIFDYAPKSNGATDYGKFIQELMTGGTDHVTQ